MDYLTTFNNHFLDCFLCEGSVLGLRGVNKTNARILYLKSVCSSRRQKCRQIILTRKCCHNTGMS